MLVDGSHLGDCVELMREIPPASIDMVLCDLPYGITKNKWDEVIPLKSLWDEWLRICKQNAAFVLTSAQPFTSFLIQSQIKLFKYCWVWDKGNPTGFLNAKKQPLRVTEDVCVFYRKQPTYNPQMEVRGKPRIKGGFIKPGGSENYGDYAESKSFNNEYYPTNLLRISNADRHKTIHSTQKPVELFEHLIKTYTNPGDLVLDNCAGSGTTGVACLNLGRRFILIEKEPEIFKGAANRLAELELMK